MSRRLLLPLVVVVACLLAACVPVTKPPPPPPPAPQPVSQYCAPTTPTDASSYQGAFDTLRRTYTEWATADGAVPVRLSASKTLWMFGDTFVGKVKPSGAIPASAPLISNSAVLQTGSCFEPIFGGTPLHRSAWIADPAAQQGYWPASAVTDPANNRLYVFLLHILRPGTVIGTRVARFKLSTLQLLGISATDLPGTSTTTPYGSTAFQQGGFAYMYSSNDGHLKVARAPLATVESQSTWQYWVDGGVDPESDSDDTWSTPGNHAAAADMPFSITVEEDLTTLDFGAPIAPLRVERHGAGYLGTAMLVDAFLLRAITFTAPTPQGPWTFAGDLSETPPGLRSYGAQTPFGLQGAPPPMLIHSVNVEEGVPLTMYNYGFRFVAVTLPAAFVASTTAEVPEALPSTEPSTTTSSTTTSSSSTSSSTASTTAPP